jgi:DNA-binding CsgD family transcriptional regulator
MEVPTRIQILDDDGSSDPALVTVLTRAGFECSAASAEGTVVVRPSSEPVPAAGPYFATKFTASEILSTIHNALQATIDRRVVEQAMSDQPTLGQPTIERAVPHRPKASLTSRELQVLGLMAAGLPNKQIADRLFISLHTARNHVKSILHKLAAHSRLEAVAIAVHDGFTERDIAEDAEVPGDSSPSTQKGLPPAG